MDHNVIGRVQKCWLEPTHTLAGECGLMGMLWNGKEWVGIYCEGQARGENLAGVCGENGKEYLRLDCDLNSCENILQAELRHSCAKLRT